jgi:hypothetical protein
MRPDSHSSSDLVLPIPLIRGGTGAGPVRRTFPLGLSTDCGEKLRLISADRFSFTLRLKSADTPHQGGLAPDR